MTKKQSKFQDRLSAAITERANTPDMTGKNGWIKCSDRIPEMTNSTINISNNVLIVDNTGIQYISAYDYEYDCWCGRRMRFKNITHWRNLPPNPTE